MVRVKDPRLMTQISALYGSGMNIKEIAAHTGVTRGTVRGYIRSPEMQDAVEAVQEGMVGILKQAVEAIGDVLDLECPKGAEIKDQLRFQENHIRLASMLVDKLGSKIITQVTTGETTKAIKSPEEKKALREQLKELLMTKEDSKPILIENEEKPV